MLIEGERWSTDAFFYDAFLDVTTLEVYLGILEDELPRVIESQRKRIWQDVKEGDEEAHYYACIAEHELDSRISTRLLTGTALVTIWATYESVIRRIADGLQEAKGLPKPKDPMRIMNARKYFKDNLHFDLYPAGTGDLIYERIQNLYALRNALAHANGRLSDVRPDEAQHRVEKLATSSSGLQISDNRDLLVSMEFVLSAFQFIYQLLVDVGQRADRELKQSH